MSTQELETFEEVVQHKKWIKTIEEEFIALKQNETSDLMSRPYKVKPIS